MLNQDTIVAVTVTFNSHELLKRCIDHLRQQTKKIYKIIVVDNHSNNNIKKKNQSIINEDIDYYYLDENTGGAGGFEYGVRQAIKYSPDWIWLMDDDAFPAHDCLENLLLYKEWQNIGCICPTIYGADKQQYQTFHHKKITKYLFKDLPMYQSYEIFPDVFNIDANAFVGPLFSAKAVNEIGLPNGKLFIYGDDTEYTYRLTRKYEMIVVKNAIINHRDLSSSNEVFNPKQIWKEYYMFRNKIIFNKKFAKNKLQCIICNLYIKHTFFKLSLRTILKKDYKKYRKIRLSTIYRGIKDGTKGLDGKTIDPKAFNKQFD